MENFSKLGDNIYQMNADGVSVNMFWASELNRDGIHIKQAANMPNEDTVTFEVKKSKERYCIKTSQAGLVSRRSSDQSKRQKSRTSGRKGIL